MGRKSIHTADQLRELILEAAEKIVAKCGLAGLSAREIARVIDYSPGTLYNMFDNLDDLLLHVEARMLDRLDAALETATADKTGEIAVRAFATKYLSFALERPKLWNLLLEHHLPPSFLIPDWYQEKLSKPVDRLEQAIMPLIGAKDVGGAKQSARALWVGVHGAASLATADKVSHIPFEAVLEMVDDLVVTYINGLATRADKDTRRYA